MSINKYHILLVGKGQGGMRQPASDAVGDEDGRVIVKSHFNWLSLKNGQYTLCLDLTVGFVVD